MTVRPDEAMGQLYPPPPPPGPPPGYSDPGPGGGAELELDIGARLALCLNDIAAALARQAAAAELDRLEWADCHPIDIPVLSSAAAGQLTDSDRWGPMAGWAWMITRLTFTLAAGGTSVTVYQDAGVDRSGNALTGNALLGPVASGTWEPKGKFLLPGRKLVVVSAGGGVTVGGEGIEIALPRLPAFLM